jgi:D-methionine transport system ATP-binding protein
LSGLLAIEDVSFSYGSHSVFGSRSFFAEEGESLAILRISGSGKSTLLDTLSGQRTPAEQI